MPLNIKFSSFSSIAALVLVSGLFPTSAVAQSYGLTERQPIGAYLNGKFPTTAPSATTGWSTVPAFPNLTFNNATHITAAPRSDRLYVSTQAGRIYSFVNNPATTSSTLVIDVSNRTQVSDSSGLLGVVFHPEFGLAGSPNRGYVYIFYTYSPNPQYGYFPCYDRLSRFTVPDGSLVADPNSELVLIQQYDPDVWHNGGGMFFAEDGFLYLSVGDAGGASDNYKTAQKLNEGLFSGVLRIDVDMNPARSHPIRRQPISRDPTAQSFTANYYIPNDNPFLNPDGSILEEYWAVGLRSPHRMTYDRIARQIWLGDVGQTTREEVNIIQRGGNYQWPYLEGTLWTSTPKPQELIGVDQPPYYEYTHADGNAAVMGGHVYRGREHAAHLDGLYIFGDNGSGRIWALAGGNEAVYLCNMPAGTALTGLSSFGEDLNGELYMCQMGPKGGIYKLSRTAGAGQVAPALLSQTGAFSNLATLTPATGIIPYEVNSPLWSDGAAKRRWIAVPNDGAPYGVNEMIGFTRTGNWSFPAGTVFIKHFEMPMDSRNPSLIKRLETRFVVRSAEGGVYGVTYKWRSDGSDADLLPGSLNEDITVYTPSGPRTQTWFYPSQQSCFSCHNDDAKHVLGVSTRQLNGTFTYPSSGVTDNQLRTWTKIGLFSSPPAESELAALDRLVPVSAPSATLEHRMRSYLDANCAHCHQPGTPRGFFDARFDTPLANQRIVDGTVANALGITDARVVAPQSVARSIMHRRMNTNDGNKMPTLARNVIDVAAVSTLEQWIASLAAGQALPSPWLNRDVGGVTYAGNVSYSNGTFQVGASGHDIWDATDGFHYVYQTLPGDGEIVARVNAVQNTNAWAKAGVMLRQSLTHDSRNTAVLMTAASGIMAQNRATTGGTTTGAPGPWGVTAPYWVRLVRTGGNVAASVSSNGTTWLQIAEYLVPTGSMYIGLAVTSHDNSLLNTSVFDNVKVTVGAVTTPTVPAAPGNLVAAAASSTRVDLTWSDQSTNEDGFAIERSTAGGGFAVVASVAGNVTTYANTGLTASTAYNYRVRATNTAGNSAYSNTASVTTPGGATTTNPPSNLVATVNSSSQITLSWADNSTTEQSFKIERSTAGGSFSQIATVPADTTTYVNTGLSESTSYSYRVRAAFSSGDSAYSNTAAAVTSGTTTPPPTGTFVQADIGSVGLAGSYEENSGTITVRGSGADIWDAADGFHFVYRSLTGDGAIEARVTSITNTDAWAKAGVMMRDTLTANSPNTATLLSAANGVYVQNRATSGAATTNTGGPWGMAAPYWVRLVRTGNTIVGSGSTDGVTWTTIATHAVSSPTIQVGLAVTSHNNGALATATFTQVRVTGGGSTNPTPPAAPSNLVATAASSARIDLAWADNSTNEEGFAIERSTDGVTFTPLATVAANVITYASTGLTASTTYTYRVRATNSAGNSAYTNAAGATTLPATGGNAPAAPSNLTATVASATQINLSWADNSSNEDGFAVERSTDGTTFAPLATVAANATTYTDTGLTAATTYTYRVRATSSGGNSGYSNTAAATTQAAGGGELPAPTGLSANVVSSTRIDLAWTDNATSETGYRVEQSSGLAGFTEIAQLAANTAAYSVTGLTAGTGYSFRVRAAGTTNSAYSNTVSATTAVAPVPDGWTGMDVGAVALAGSEQISGESITVRASGADIEGTSDAFRFVYRTISGDGAIEARVTSLTRTHPWAKAGVMIRQGLTTGAANSAVLLTANNGVTVQHRASSGGTTAITAGTKSATAPYWVRLVRTGNTVVASSSANGTTWTTHSTQTVALGATVQLGVAVTSHNNSSLATATFESVRITGAGGGGGTPEVPAAPSSLMATAASASRIDLAWTDNASSEEGFGIERSNDGTTFTQIATVPANATTYANTGLTASTAYSYRVRALSNAGNSGYSNVAAATTPAAGVLAAPSNLIATATSGTQIELSWNDNSADETGFKIERASGLTTFAEIATVAANVRTYTNSGLTAGTGYSYRVRASGTAGDSAFSNVATVTTPTGTSTWSHADIGSVGVPGSDDAGGNTITVRGSGNDIWDTADGFRFLYRTVTGDTLVEAQVTSVTNTNAWAKAGVMIRESVAANAANVFVLVTPASGVGVQQRPTTGAQTTFASGPWGAAAPYWVRLRRTGNTFVASVSADGTTWTTVATYTTTMGATVQVGFAVTSHDNAQLSTAVFTDPFIQ